MTVYLDPDLCERIRVQSAKTREELSEIVENAVRAYYDNPDRETRSRRPAGRPAAATA